MGRCEEVLKARQRMVQVEWEGEEDWKWHEQSLHLMWNELKCDRGWGCGCNIRLTWAQDERKWQRKSWLWDREAQMTTRPMYEICSNRKRKLKSVCDKNTVAIKPKYRIAQTENFVTLTGVSYLWHLLALCHPSNNSPHHKWLKQKDWNDVIAAHQTHILYPLLLMVVVVKMQNCA